MTANSQINHLINRSQEKKIKLKFITKEPRPEDLVWIKYSKRMCLESTSEKNNTKIYKNKI